MAELDFPPTFLLSKIKFQLTIRYQTKYTVWCQKWCTSLTAFFSGPKHHLSADERPKHVGKGYAYQNTCVRVVVAFIVSKQQT